MRIEITGYDKLAGCHTCVVDGMAANIDVFVGCAVKLPPNSTEEEYDKIAMELIGKKFKTKRDMRVFRPLYMPDENDFEECEEEI